MASKSGKTKSAVRSQKGTVQASFVGGRGIPVRPVPISVSTTPSPGQRSSLEHPVGVPGPISVSTTQKPSFSSQEEMLASMTPVVTTGLPSLSGGIQRVAPISTLAQTGFGPTPAPRVTPVIASTPLRSITSTLPQKRLETFSPPSGGGEDEDEEDDEQEDQEDQEEFDSSIERTLIAPGASSGGYSPEAIGFTPEPRPLRVTPTVQPVTRVVQPVKPLKLAVASTPKFIAPTPGQGVDSILRSLRSKTGELVFKPDQVTRLLSMKLQDGSPIFVPDSSLYSLVIFAIQFGADKTLKWLSEKTWKDRGEILRANPSLQKARDKLEVDVQIYKNKTTEVEGIYPCKYCHRTRTILVEKQLRSGDESAHIFVTCLDCVKTFQPN